MQGSTSGSLFDIDLNNVRDHNRVTVLLRRAVGFMPRVESGDWVRLRDEDGNLMDALVDTVDDGRLRLKIDWGSWMPAGRDLSSATTFGADTYRAVTTGSPTPV